MLRLSAMVDIPLKGALINPEKITQKFRQNPTKSDMPINSLYGYGVTYCFICESNRGLLNWTGDLGGMRGHHVLVRSLIDRNRLIAVTDGMPNQVEG